MGLSLATLIDVPVLQSMLDDFYSIACIPMSLVDMDGTIVVGAGWQYACTRFHRVNPETCEHCRVSDTVLSAGIAPGETRLYRCENGMWDAATPVMAGDRQVGNIFTGQFFFDDESVDLTFFRQQAIRYGFDQTAYLDAIGRVPCLSRTTVEVGLRFLTTLASLISRQSVSNAERVRGQEQLQTALSKQITLSGQLERERGVLSTIMENTDTSLAYFDPDFRFVAVNSAYARGSGYSEEDLLGAYHFDLFRNAENEAIFQRCKETGQPVEFSAKPFESPGQPWRGITYWDWRLTPVKRADGSIEGFTLSTRDVTRAVRQRAMDDALNRLDEIMHSDLDADGILSHSIPELAAASGCEVVVAMRRLPDGRWEARHAVGLGEGAVGEGLTDEALPLTAESLRTGRPVVAFAARSGTDKGLLGVLDLRSMLVVPLSAAGEVLGAVVLGYRSGPGEFDEFVVDFAAKMGTSMSLALNNARLFHDATRAAALSSSLAKVNEILLSALTVDDVIARLVGEVSRLAGADKSLVVDVDEGAYTVTHVRGASMRLVGKRRDASYYPGFAMAASAGRPVLIGDTWSDPRTNKDFVVPNKLRAFELLPISADGRVRAVLALAYDAPRSFDQQDFQAAERMAVAMSVALGNARLYENQHTIADRLQEALLALPREIDGLDLAHAYHSATETARVGGDFFDAFELGDDRVGLTIGDVAGKGLDAAMLTSLAKNAIRAFASEQGRTPAPVLELTNTVVFRGSGAEAFVTLFFGVLDRTSGRVRYASAGHPSGVVAGGGRVITTLPGTGPVLGAFERVTYEEGEVALGPGDVLFLYTDGLTEARGAQGLYGEKRLLEGLPKWHTGTALDLVEEAAADVLAYAGGKLRDDLAMLAVMRAQRKPRAARGRRRA